MKSEATKSENSPAAQFFHHIDGVFDARADHVLAELPDGPLTYAQCRAEMLRLVGAFKQLGLAPGDRALIQSHQDRVAITLFLAMLRCGITPVIADPNATMAECAELTLLCDVCVTFADGTIGQPASKSVVSLGAVSGREEGQSLDMLCEKSRAVGFPTLTQEPDRAMLVLTSGTTSTPKAVELTHANLIAQMEIFAQVYGFDRETRLLNPLPLHHVDGLIRGPLAALWFGGSVFRKATFSVEATPGLLKSIASDAITHLISVPAMLRIIERLGRELPTSLRTPDFRFVLSSADLLDTALWQRFEETFGVPVVNAYGLSEVVCDALFAGLNGEGSEIGTLGRPVGCTVRVVDETENDVDLGETGELLLSGSTIMRGYFRAPEATAAVIKDRWFHTGDYVRINTNGSFEFVGRKKTAIVSAGVTIHPETATQVVSAMPGVLEAVAFGVPDEAMGERLVAAIVPAPGSEITVAAAAAHCRSALSPERSPREFRILPSLPRGASGKVLVNELIDGQMPGVLPKADVLAIAAQCFKVPVETLSPASTPFNTDGWDSLAHMNLIDSLEEAFGLEFTAIQIAQIMSLDDARRFINEVLSD